MLQPLAEEAATRVGSVLADKWRLDALLGLGSSAAVYAATHKNGNRVAIKLMHPDLAVVARRVDRFLREAYVANSIAHPAVVRIFDDGRWGEQAFFVLELLEGDTLDALRKARGGRLPFTELRPLCRTLLEVLEVAHAAGVLHRDIKPSNLFRETSGALRVLDFGLAAALDAERDPEASLEPDSAVGTAGFMAPEQAAGRQDLVDARSDVWSVGATFLYLLTGHYVHDARTSQELIARVATQPIKPAAEIAPELEKPVARWLDRALAFSRDERFASAREAREALDAIGREGEHADSLSRPAASPRRSLGLGLGVAALALVALVAGAAWMLRERRVDPPVEMPSRLPEGPVTSASATTSANANANVPALASSSAAPASSDAPRNHGSGAGHSTGTARAAPPDVPVRGGASRVDASVPERDVRAPGPAPDPLDRRL